MNNTIYPEDPEAIGDPGWSQRWRRQRRWLWVGVGAGLLTTLIVAGFVIRVPKVAFLPGGVQSTSDLVEVDGVETFESDGELFYATVQIPRLSLWDWLWRETFDDSADVHDEDVVFGDQTREETRTCNAQMMRTSKSTASLVALDQLGYDPVSPTGASVEQVLEGSPADESLSCGDVIVAVDGVGVSTGGELREAIVGLDPGVVVELEVEGFDGPSRIEAITLTDNGEGGGLLGVRAGTRFDENELAVDVTIDTGNVGGPSAGLAFTLAILDTMTDGDLTGGIDVALTGTILLDGTVGPVGGIRQKVISARRSGVEVFLMPMQPVCEDDGADCERDRILAEAGDMQVVEVSTLDDALTALGGIGGDPLT